MTGRCELRSSNDQMPDSCGWASIAGLRSSAPVVAQGDESTFPGAGLTLDPGRYLVSDAGYPATAQATADSASPSGGSAQPTTTPICLARKSPTRGASPPMTTWYVPAPPDTLKTNERFSKPASLMLSGK